MKDYLKKLLDKRGILICVCISVLVTLVIEMLNRGSVLKGFVYMLSNPFYFFYNIVIVMLTMSLALFFKRRLLCISAISFIWLVLGIVNCVVMSFRETPLTLTDFAVAMTATSIAGLYINVFQIILIVIAVTAVVFLFIYIKKNEPKVKTNFMKAFSVVAMLGVMLVLPENTYAFSSDFSDLTDAYEDYGFAYCFSLSVIEQGIRRPDNYSRKSIDEITEGLSSENSDEPKKPNIIYLQMESFFDLSRLNDIGLSENTMPFFSSLKEKFPSGHLSVPSVGGGTANTEFEILTGMNVNDFGPGAYPYLGILKQKECLSIASDLKASGYTTHAIHNYIRNFYDRDKVYANLGIDDFVSVENMNDIEYNSIGWAKDIVLKDEIMKALSSTQSKDFIFAVSVQGHGKYPEDYSSGGIKVDGLATPQLKSQYEYYADQTREMDDFLKALVAELENYGEDVVLVIYGDHLPSLEITDNRLNDGNIYQTDYVIWSNFDAESKDEDIESFQLSSKIFDMIGSTGGVLPSYHNKNIGSDKYFDNMKMLEYDILYGDQFCK